MIVLLTILMSMIRIMMKMRSNIVVLQKGSEVISIEEEEGYCCPIFKVYIFDDIKERTEWLYFQPGKEQTDGWTVR